MRLALKITWMAMLAVAVGLGIQAKVRLDRELQLIEMDMLRDHRLIGRALGPSLESTLSTRGREAVDGALSAAIESEQEIQMRLVPGSSVAEELQHALADDGIESLVEEHDGTTTLTTYLQLRGAHGAPVLRLLERSTAKADFAASARNEFLWLLAILLPGMTVVGALAGYALVGRRVERLVRSARAVSAGDLSVRPEEAGRDEVGVLSCAMGEMIEQLASARSAAGEAEVHRGNVVQRLRHADRLATLGTLASRFAHDIGTPLNVIEARAKMIGRGEIEGQRARQSAEIIAAQSEHIAERVREVLRFARSKTQTREQTDLRSILAETKVLLDSLARAHGVSIVVDAPVATLASVYPLLLQQALVNLTVNAIHASARGDRVSLSTRTTRRPGPPHQVAPRSFAEIVVADEGSGVPSSIRARIFESFFTTKPSGAGTGLGLPIVAEIVQEHAGYIEVRDGKPTGAEFVIYLPLEVRDA